MLLFVCVVFVSHPGLWRKRRRKGKDKKKVNGKGKGKRNGKRKRVEGKMKR